MRGFRATARLCHLIVGGFAGRWKFVSVQEKLQQADVAEDGGMKEARTTHSSVSQLSALLQQQTEHKHMK